MAEETKDTQATEKASPADKELTEERRAELRKKIRERMSKSKLDVKAPKGWTPYWARKDDTSEMARLDYLGFRVVKEKSEAVRGKAPRRYQAQGAREDGTYVMGDVILMEVPTEEYEIMMEENSERSRNMAAAAKQRFIDEAESKGSPTFAVRR